MARTEYAIRLAKPSLCRNLVERERQRKEKLAVNKRLCQQQERKARLRGCGCPNCQPELYDRPEPVFNACKGLQWRKEDAWDLARMAVASFARVRLVQSQLTALISWSTWSSRSDRKTSRKLSESDVQTVAGIFSGVFFLGALPPSKLAVAWVPLKSPLFGVQTPSLSSMDPEAIWLNASHHLLQFGQSSQLQAVRTILHEMIHAYLSRYTCYPWHTVECANGLCGRSYRVHLGVTGHGRAFHYMAKAIEDHAPRLLGLPLCLGRDSASMFERKKGGFLPCRKDIMQLYNGRRMEHVWQHLTKSQDDSAITTDILLDYQGEDLLPRARRSSDTNAVQSTTFRASRLC